MKRSELLFNFIAIPADWVMIIVAGITAFYLRFRLAPVRPILYQLSIRNYFEILVLISPVILILLALAGLYNLKGTRRMSSELLRIVLADFFWTVVRRNFVFLQRDCFPFALIILFTWGLTIVLTVSGELSCVLSKFVCSNAA
jgi:hypothetical protein